MLTSTSAYHRYTARQISELVYLHVIGLRILSVEHSSAHFAADYAHRSARYLGFAKWYQNATDLHLLLHALVSEDVELKMPDASQEFKETLYFDETQMRRWLKRLDHPLTAESMTRSLFMQMDGQFRIKDSSAKAIRRLVQDWPRISLKQKQLAMTRLLQMMRVRAKQSDLLVELERVAKELKLEMHNVANPETGDEAPDDHHGHHPEPEKKSGSLWGKIAAGIAGAVIGYKGVRKLGEDEQPIGDEELVEDDGGGATTSADVAPVIKPISGIRRRNPKRKKK